MLAYLLFTNIQETETTEVNYGVYNSTGGKAEYGHGSIEKHVGTSRWTKNTMLIIGWCDYKLIKEKVLTI